MGIFKSLLSGLGFKQEEQEDYENRNNSEQEVEKVMPVGQAKDDSADQKQVSVSNLVCYAPSSNQDVKLLVDHLKNGEPCIVNLGALSKPDIKSILDYLGGAMYALGGMISRLQGDIYVLSPKDVKVTAM